MSRAPDFRGVRFRVSVLLLLSTLNTVLLSVFALSLLTVISRSPSPARFAAVRNIGAQLAGAHDRIVLAGRPGSPPPDERTLAQIDGMRAALGQLGGDDDVRAADREVLGYREAVLAWRDHVLSPQHVPTYADEDEAGARLLADVRLAHQRLTASVAHLVDYERPAWVDAVDRRLPFAAAWVLGFSVVTVAIAWSLRSRLTVPLERLADAARSVAEGRFDQRWADVGDAAPEVRELAVALRAAGARVNETIAELDVQNRRVAAMLEHLQDGVLLTDAAGRVIESNDQADRMLRFLAPTMGLSQPLPEAIPELATAFAAGDAGVVTLERGRALARRRWFEVLLRDVPGTDHGRARLVLVRDVSDAREIEQIKRDFLSVVTHELRTPLTAIEGYAKLLVMKKGGDLSERQEGFVRTIQEQAVLLRSMIQNLLDVTRLEGGNLPIHAASTDLGLLVQRLSATWQGAVEGRRLRWRCSAEGASGCNLRVDPARVEQAIGNLVSNAIKFTPEGGEVALEVTVDGREAHLVVADTGRGVPPEAVDRIFEKFYQVEHGDTRVAGGAGLGLYIVRQLVEAQGGRVDVRSTVGEGSRFGIHFPILEETA